MTGLAALTSPEAVAAARPGATIRVRPEAGEIEVDGKVCAAQPLPQFMLELLEAGGLAPWIKGLSGKRS